MIQIAGVLLCLPDGRVVVNRRWKKAPTDAGLLALYGAHIEPGETASAAAARELSEETSLIFMKEDFKPIACLNVSTAEGLNEFHIFELGIENENFKVFEGKGSESYDAAELLARDDITLSLRMTLESRK